MLFCSISELMEKSQTMSHHNNVFQSACLAAAFMAAPMMTLAQSDDYSNPDMPPVNALPNPYVTVEDWAKLPDGREWGSTSAIDVAPDGEHIWVAERCSGNINACVINDDLDPVMQFDRDGNLVTSFGAGLITWPHGIDVDHEGNVWVTDARDNHSGDQEPNEIKGHQVHKFSPDGEHLMTLGEPGGAREPGYFFQPNDVLVTEDGTIFVAEGHSNDPAAPARVLKFNSDGEFISDFGEFGTEPGQFMQPHSLAVDSRDRLFVADRSNDRLQIFTQDGELLDIWYQFSRISGLYIDENDVLYAADSESGSLGSSQHRTDWTRGIRVGDAATGEVDFIIPDPLPDCTGTCTAEGVVVDRFGNIYGAEVGPVGGVKRYEPRYLD